MQTLETSSPVEIDTKLAELYFAESKLRSERDRINDSLVQSVIARAKGEPCYTPYTVDDLEVAENKLIEIIAQIDPLEAEYNRRPWQRYWHVTNKNGHIHRNQSCTSCYPDTQYGWRVDLSGLTDVEVVEREAYNACSVCMPIAPAEQKAAREYFNKQQREARAAEKQAKKDEKLNKQAIRAQKFLNKVEGIVEKHYGSWEILFRDYSLHGHDGKKSLYESTFDIPTQVGDYLYDEMAIREHYANGGNERLEPSRHQRDPKAIIAEATEKGLI